MTTWRTTTTTPTTATVIMPLLLPRLSDRAAVQLLQILEQLLACVRQHYAPQLRRWQRATQKITAPDPPPELFDDLPF
jgi:hypothetical protein